MIVHVCENISVDAFIRGKQFPVGWLWYVDSIPVRGKLPRLSHAFSRIRFERYESAAQFLYDLVEEGNTHASSV